MKKRLFIVLLAAAVALTAVSALAQANTGQVKGKVTDMKGKLVTNGVVKFIGPDGSKTEVKTDKQGEFISAGLPAGRYKVELYIGRELSWQGEGEVVAGTANTMNIDMAAGAFYAKMSPEERKKYDQEQEEKRKKIEADRNKIKNLNTMLAQAQPMMESGNYDGAIGIYQQTVQLDPTRDLLWANLGGAYLSKAAASKDKNETAENATKAAEALQKAVSLKPADGAYHNNLGQAYARAGKIEDALKEFQTAAQGDPTSAARYYFNAGAILTNESTKLPPSSPAQKKKLDEANEMFKKSAEADAHYSEGEAYYQIATNLLSQATIGKDGKTMVVPDGTTEAYQKYLELSPTGRFSESAKQTLAALGTSVETTYKKSGKKK